MGEVKLRLGNKLILVSNREPYIHEKSRKGIMCKRAMGGLVSTLDPVMQSYGGTWVAWGSGDADFEVTDSQNRVQVPCENPRYMLKRVRLSEREISRYYYGFSNRVLWPISHLFIEKAYFNSEYWRAYRRVNAKFAKVVLDEAASDDMIWVHDYHLSMVPRFIRDANEDAKIAFFWHIPWPPWEVFGSLPWRGEIIEGLLSSDLIGFHTQPYVKNFMECAERLGASIDRRRGIVKLSDREVRVKAFPIGIDHGQLASFSSSKKMGKKAKILRRLLRAKYLILGVDRLDYTKGILNRLRAFGGFLEKYPEFIGKVVFVQITTPSRTRVEEYRKMKREIDEIVGRINGRFQKVDWIPIRYFYRSIPRERLLAYYLAADVALVTPLIDGMNLVAKEYITTKGDSGTLILSEFTGAAKELKEAILVNPYDTEDIIEALKKALEMSPVEKRQRFEALKQKVKKHDIYWWSERFFGEWRKMYD